MSHGVQIQIGRSFPGHGLYWWDKLEGDPLVELVVVLSGMFVNYFRSGHRWAYTFLANAEPAFLVRLPYDCFHYPVLVKYDGKWPATVTYHHPNNELRPTTLMTHWSSTN